MKDNALVKNVVTRWKDILLGMLVSAAFMVGTYQGGKTIPVIILDHSSMDEWFEGGMPRVFDNMTWRESDNSKIKDHPLFTLTTHPVVALVKKVCRTSPLNAVRGCIAAIAFAWMFVLFSLMRILGCRRLDSVLFCALAGGSAASMFWFTVPETFPFGSLSILLALILVPLSQSFAISPIWFVLVNIATLSFVITNWLAGILATLVTQPFRRARHIIVYSFALVTVLWAVQKHIYPSVKFFLGESSDAGNFNVVNQKAGGLSNVLCSFFYHTLVMPGIQVVDHWFWHRPVMITQLSAPGSGTNFGIIAVILWTVLLGLGVWALFSLKEHFKFRVVLGLLLSAQLLLHIVFGAETFLYSLHFIVLLIPLAALGSLTKFRPVVVVLLFLLIPCVMINNLTQFKRSKDFLRQQYEQRQNYKSVISEATGRPR